MNLTLIDSRIVSCSLWVKSNLLRLGFKLWKPSLENKVIFMKRHFYGLLKTLLRLPKANTSGVWQPGLCHLSRAPLIPLLQMPFPSRTSYTLFPLPLTPFPVLVNSYSTFGASEKLSSIVRVTGVDALYCAPVDGRDPRVASVTALFTPCCYSSFSPTRQWSSPAQGLETQNRVKHSGHWLDQ